MDHLTLRDREMKVDLERGVGVNEDNSEEVSVLDMNNQTRTLLGSVCAGLVDSSIKGEDRINPCGNELNSKGVCSTANVELHIMSNGSDSLGCNEKTPAKEKRKKTSNKKPLLPPRPPRGPSLDAADQKLIREISELALLKRARVERMKTLKRMKAAKSSSSSSNIFALVFTILFLLVIIFQGMSSGKNSGASFQESPGGMNGGLISIQHHLNPSSNEPNSHVSESPNFLQPVAGSDPPDKLRRALA